MSQNFTQLISVLEENCDPSVAYFSYAADDRGERGVIRANKEGLRLYALDLLRKSVQMEERQDGKNLCFKQSDWMINEAGYNLISGVKPEYGSRDSILRERFSSGKERYEEVQEKLSANKATNSGCLGGLLLITGTLASFGAIIKKCFL